VNYTIVSLSKRAKKWLLAKKPSRVLHVFEKSCNLINENGDIFSLVGPLIRNGPFSAVLVTDDFSSLTDRSDLVEIKNLIVRVGNLSFDATKAIDWDSTIDWTLLHTRKTRLLTSINLIEELISRYAPAKSFAEIVLAIAKKYQPSDPIFRKAETAIFELNNGLKIGNIMAMRNAAKSLAGLGSGLTPAGDDYLVGTMMALYAWEKGTKAQELSSILAEESIPLTNSISAAWLKATQKGEAGQSWHDLISAMANDHGELLAEAVMRILPTGHTSGADALGAFVATIRILSEKGKAA